MATGIHTKRFSITTDLLSAGQWYAPSYSVDMPGNEKNNSDHHQWPDDIGT
ncbi:MAG: hypothetical protein QM687_00280 [Ferruginibacter sp.]